MSKQDRIIIGLTAVQWSVILAVLNDTGFRAPLIEEIKRQIMERNLNDRLMEAHT